MNIQEFLLNLLANNVRVNVNEVTPYQKKLKIDEEENNILPTKREKESGSMTLKTDGSPQSRCL